MWYVNMSLDIEMENLRFWDLDANFSGMDVISKIINEGNVKNTNEKYVYLKYDRNWF